MIIFLKAEFALHNLGLCLWLLVKLNNAALVKFDMNQSDMFFPLQIRPALQFSWAHLLTFPVLTSLGPYLGWSDGARLGRSGLSMCKFSKRSRHKS